MAEDEDDLEEDELSRPPPPSPVEVARRALVLSGVVCRAFIENHKDEKSRDTAEEIHEWFDELELWPYLEPYEQEIINAEFGTMDRHLNITGTWFVEGLAILAWALRRGKFPPHDKQVDPIAVTNSLDFLSPDAANLLAAPTLRPAEEIKAAREWFYDVHCSLRGFLNWNGDGHLASWIGDYVKVLGLKRKKVMAGKSLAFEGKPLAETDRERLEQWEPVICERHRASMWLVGDEDPYTEISVDT
jgi:uncharacterized protein DUF4272